jgi:ABC-type xylose transport system permease subunit
MERPTQFSLAYVFLEMFWIAGTLAAWRESHLLYFRHREFFGGWNPSERGTLFLVLVIAAIFCGGTAVGGLVGRMQLGAVVGAIAAIVAMVFLSPSAH